MKRTYAAVAALALFAAATPAVAQNPNEFMEGRIHQLQNTPMLRYLQLDNGAMFAVAPSVNMNTHWIGEHVVVSYRELGPGLTAHGVLNIGDVRPKGSGAGNN
jgi:hypothetical protein